MGSNESLNLLNRNFIISKTRRKKMKKLAMCSVVFVFIFSTLLVANSFATDQLWGPWNHKACGNKSVPSATVTRPAWTPDRIGDVARNYSFFSPYAELADYGYVQEEFFIEGLASNYNIPTGATGSLLSSGHPYKTRIVVRRPVSPHRFNGTVLLEWQNVTAGYDLDAHWISWKHFLRAGYVWVGVSAQRVGVHGVDPVPPSTTPNQGLKAWNPNRYGTLDVTAGGTITDDSLCYDIFSQAAQAVRCPKGIDPLAGLNVKLLLAIGASQSASRLTIYYNSIHPLHNVIDAFYLLVGGYGTRTDLATKIFQVVSEREVKSGAYRRIANSDNHHTWEIAGAAHSGYDSYLYRKPITSRDGLVASSIECSIKPVFSRIPTVYALNAAYDHLVRWVKSGTPPPTAPLIEGEFLPPPSTTFNIARDARGNALGGLRLPQIDVPIATNNGADNGGPAFCVLYGYFTLFDDATLQSLYPSHHAYFNAFKKATYKALKAGYIVKEDVEEMLLEAANSDIP
jgi:hypothetical protein